MKKIILASLLAISLRGSSQIFDKNSYLQDTVKAYIVAVDTRNNHVRGYMGWCVRALDIKLTVLSNPPKYEYSFTPMYYLDQRRKPFPKTFLIIYTKEL